MREWYKSASPSLINPYKEHFGWLRWLHWCGFCGVMFQHAKFDSDPELGKLLKKKGVKK